MFHENDPCPQPFQLNASALEPCTNLGTYDYFTGSEIGFTYSCVFLAFVPILGVMAAYSVVKYQSSKRRRLKVKQEALRYVNLSTRQNRQRTNKKRPKIELNVILLFGTRLETRTFMKPCNNDDIKYFQSTSEQSVDR